MLTHTAASGQSTVATGRRWGLGLSGLDERFSWFLTVLGYTVNGRFRAIVMMMFCGLALVASGCATQAPSQASEPTPSGVVPDNATYVVGAGDSLSVFVYRSPELSVPDLPVRPDGRISVPLIEDIMAAGKTPTQLAREIESRLKKYVKDPSVTVIVRGFVGPLDRQVKVIGEATEPVALPYRDHMTVLDVMIATKGLTKFAAGNSAVIIRRDPAGRQATIRVRLNDLVKDGDISQNVEMAPGDTLIIPQTWF
jgi:polysaccharide biosynthesis/export protein